MWIRFCSKKVESKAWRPRLVGKNAQLLREMSDHGSGFPDNAALDVGVVGKGFNDDVPTLHSPKTGTTGGNRRQSQRGCSHCHIMDGSVIDGPACIYILYILVPAKSRDKIHQSDVVTAHLQLSSYEGPPSRKCCPPSLPSSAC